MRGQRAGGTRRRGMAVALVLILALTASGCGGDEGLAAVSDDSTCAEVVEIVDEAIAAARSYIARQASDPAEADEIVFALSGAEERSECLDEETVRRATGLRLTVVSSS